MSGLILPARFRRQPQYPALLEAKWRSKAARCVYLPNSLQPIDLSGNGRTSADATCTATLDTDAVGRVWNFGTGSATSRLYLPQGALNGVGGVTWIAVVYATSVADCTIAHTDTGEGGGSGSGVSLRVNSGQLQIIAPGVAVLAAGPTITTNRWYVVAMRFTAGNGSSGCAATFAVDGVLTAGTSLDNSAPTNDATGRPAIGAQNSSTRNWQGKIGMFAGFDALFSDGDLVEITRNPWQLFKYPRRNWADLATGATGITGTSTATLADVTSTATAALQLKADSNVTLANVSTAGATNLAIAAAGSKTLDDVTGAATGALRNTGAASVTLADVTSSATGAVQIKAAVSVTLADVAGSADSDLVVVGTGGGQLDDVTLVASGVGTAVNTGTSATTLADVTGSATGTVQIKAASNVTLADVSTAGATTLYLVGASSKTLDDVTSSATGALRNTGAVAVTLANVTLSAAGAAEVPRTLLGPRPGGARSSGPGRLANTTASRPSSTTRARSSNR